MDLGSIKFRKFEFGNTNFRKSRKFEFGNMRSRKFEVFEVGNMTFRKLGIMEYRDFGNIDREGVEGLRPDFGPLVGVVVLGRLLLRSWPYLILHPFAVMRTPFALIKPIRILIQNPLRKGLGSRFQEHLPAVLAQLVHYPFDLFIRKHTPRIFLLPQLDKFNNLLILLTLFESKRDLL